MRDHLRWGFRAELTDFMPYLKPHHVRRYWKGRYAVGVCLEIESNGVRSGFFDCRAFENYQVVVRERFTLLKSD